MSCNLIYSNGKLKNVLDDSGKPSKLYKDAMKMFGEQKALDIFLTSKSKSFISVFGEKEPTLKTVLNFITEQNSSKEKLSKEQELEIFNTSINIKNFNPATMVELFYDDNGLFIIDKNKLKESGYYTDYEIENLQDNFDNIKLAIEKLKNSDDIKYSEQDYDDVEKTNIVNSFGKMSVLNPNIVNQEIIQVLGGIEDRNEFDLKLAEIEYPQFQKNVDKDSLFKEMQEYKQAEVYVEDNGQIRPEKNTETESILPIVAKLSNNASKLSTITSVDLDVLQENEQETRKVLENIENTLIEDGLDLIGLSEKPINQKMKMFLVSLQEFLISPTKENTKDFADKYNELFEKNLENKTEKIKADKNFIKLDTNLSEEELFDKYSFVKAGENLYFKVNKKPLSEMYNILKTYPEKEISEEEVLENYQDFSNIENAQAVYLFKKYFDFPQKTESKQKIKQPKNKVSEEFVSDFYIKMLKEKKKNSFLYNNFYKFFSVNGKGLYLTHTDNITMGQIKMFADQELKDYSLLSKQMPDLTDEVVNINDINTRRDIAINYPNTVKNVKEQVYFLPKENEIIVKDTTEEFIKIGENIFEKVDELNNLSLYLQLEKNNTEYNIVGAEKPTTTTNLNNFSHLSTQTKEVKEKTYLDKQEKETEKQENYNCK